MTEVAHQVNNSADKVASLMKEAETLKQKLEEERQKLNDVTCKLRKVFISRKQKQIFHLTEFFSVEHRRPLGDHQLLKHQAAAHLEGSSGQSIVFRLVAGQTSYSQQLSGRKIDYLGCFLDQQSE